MALIIGVSLSDEKEIIKTGYSVIPRMFSTYTYKYMITTSRGILQAYWVTIASTVCGTVLHVLFTSMFAYPLSRPEFPWRRGFSLFIFITMLFGGGLVPWYIMCTQLLHIQDTLFALFVPAMFSGYNCFVLRTFIKSNIPDSLIESARIDGSGEWRTYLRIVLPLSKAGLATIGFFVALGIWNDWYCCLLFINKRPELTNLNFLLYKMMTQIQALSKMASQEASVAIYGADLRKAVPSESARMALCIVSIGPIVLAYPFFQRFFIKGLVIGAVKG
jgi:putative aldouronate transport system permease protein